MGTRRKFLDWVPYKKLRCDGPGSDLAEPAENMKLQRQKKNHLFFERQGHFKFSDLKFNFSNFSEEKKSGPLNELNQIKTLSSIEY